MDLLPTKDNKRIKTMTKNKAQAILDKIISWEQLKYMAINALLCIAHFSIMGFVFGFDLIVNDRLFSFYIQMLFNVSLFIPLFMVLIVFFHEKIHFLFDGKAVLIYFVYGIPLLWVAYIVMFLVGLTQRIGLLADVSVLMLTWPISIMYALKWYDDLFNNDKKVRRNQND